MSQLVVLSCLRKLNNDIIKLQHGPHHPPMMVKTKSDKIVPFPEVIIESTGKLG